MFNQYEPNVKATIEFLRLLKVKVNDSTVNETLQNHPDWPTLLCISDSLNKWNIPNGAGKINPEGINELPTPFIAYTGDAETPLYIVTAVTDATIEVYKKGYSKAVNEPRKDFLQKWGGVYLIAEPNDQSGEADYEKNKRKTFIKSIIPVAAFAVLAVVSFLLIVRNYSGLNSSLFSTTGAYFQFLILFCGIIMTSLLLWYEIDKNNPLLQKVCTGIAKGNCNAILTGRQAKLLNWLSWSEVGFFYFIGGFFVLLFADGNITSSLGLVAWLNILAVPYIIFSVYYRWQIARQWCVLCLVVQALLLTGGINCIVSVFLIPFPAMPATFIVSTSLLYLLPALAWYAAKPYILRLQEAKNIRREYLRIKFNTEIFDTLLKKQKSVTASVEGLGITLGNPAAANELIKVCNPYCGPCAKAHPKIEALLEQQNNLKARIIFTAPNDEDNMMTKPVRHLLAIEEKKNEALTKKALDDWYLVEEKNYENFASHYPMNGELTRQGDRIEAMHKWCKAMGVNVTPTIFLNGYQLPDAYSIEDLQYFLLE